jgi:hypothetical protein
VVDELALAGILFAAIALISCLSVADKRVIRRLPRALWVAVILLVPLAGPVAWFVAGRPIRTGPDRPVWRALRGLDQPPRLPAPDDDPDFLRSLGAPGTDRPDEARRRQEADDRARRAREEQPRPDPEPGG